MIRYSRTKAIVIIFAVVGVGVIAIVMTRGGGSKSVAVEGSNDTEGDGTKTVTTSTRRLDSIVVGGPTAQGNGSVAKVEGSPTHRSGPRCESCTTENCTPTTDGCDLLADESDKKLCEELYGCFTDPINASCVIAGDPTRCWCGTHLVTCVTDSDGPKRANGACADLVIAASRSTDADTIWKRFLDPAFPLGRAVRLTTCRGSFCPTECQFAATK